MGGRGSGRGGAGRVCVGCVVSVLLIPLVTSQCLSGLRVSVRQSWSDIEVGVTWPPSLLLRSAVWGESLWLLLRTGAPAPRATTIATANASFPDWPFDRAVQLRVPHANLTDASCPGCEAHVWWSDGAWVRRAFPAEEPAWTDIDEPAPRPTTLLFDDNALGLPRNETIEWCARRRASCGECEASGSFRFDASLRWNEGAVQLASSHRHVCAVRESGRVQCWGWNAWGQLGVNHTLSVDESAQWWREPTVGVEDAVEAVAAGWAHSCALTRDGAVWCWGLNAHGQLGAGDAAASLVPRRSVSIVDAQVVVASGNRSCAVLGNGSLACWGSNSWGELGLGDTAHRLSPTVISGVTVASAALGWWHTCVVGLADATLRCWGRNSWGQLGLGHTQTIGDNETVAAASSLAHLGPIDSIGGGETHTCATLRNGSALCWGGNAWGQLGLGHTQSIGDNETVTLGTARVQMGDTVLGWSLGSRHSCAVVLNQWLKCWGADGDGQLGVPGNATLGDNEDVAAVWPVQTGGPVLSAAASSTSTCIVRHWGSVECWGSNGTVPSNATSRGRDAALAGSTVRPVVSSAAIMLHNLRVHDAQSAALQLSVGVNHVCAVTVAREVRCWGYNAVGQLGLGHKNMIGDNEPPSSAPPVSLGGPALSVACGELHTCAVMASGALRCWGRGSSGQVGLSNTDDVGDNEHPSSVAPVSVGETTLQVAAGLLHTCAVLASGVVRCWGANSSGQLGLGHASNIGDNEHPSSTPPVSVGGQATAVSAHGAFSCVILVGGVVRCWGLNDLGQLGLGSVEMIGNNELPTSVNPVSLGAPAVAIAGGNSHACAVLVGGLVRCWGRNTDGQLGLGTSDRIGDDEVPSSVAPLFLGEPAVMVSCGLSHSCAVLASGRVLCWGRNSEAQLGQGMPGSVASASSLASAPLTERVRTAEAISSGDYRTCISSKGEIQCWGDTLYGALGGGLPATQVGDGSRPVNQSEPTGVRAQVVAANGYFSCSLFEGQVRCWGRNNAGQLGLGHTQLIGDDEVLQSANAVPLPSPVREIACGDQHVCAVLDDRSLRCWGRASNGQLGLGGVTSIGDNESPASVGPVSIGGPAASIACGMFHTCVLLASGAVRCWGLNTNGQLGLGHVWPIGGNASALPSSVGPVVLTENATAVGCGAYFSCAVLVSGSVVCWGFNNYGQLGLGHTNTIGDDELPSAADVITWSSPVQQLSLGGGHACVLLLEGSLRCWGRNDFGQLGLGFVGSVGDNELATSVAAVDVGGAVQIVAGGGTHTCVVLLGGRVRCWGFNNDGQVGAGNTARWGDNEAASMTPLVPLNATVVSLACGLVHTCAVTDAAVVWCWGGNSDGQLGLGHKAEVGSVAEYLEHVTVAGIRILDPLFAKPLLQTPIILETSPEADRILLSRRFSGIPPTEWDSSASPLRFLHDTPSLRAVAEYGVLRVHPTTSSPLLCPTVPSLRSLGVDVCVLTSSTTTPWSAGAPTLAIIAVNVSSPRDEVGVGTRATVSFSSPWAVVDPNPRVWIGSAVCGDLHFVDLTTLECSVRIGQGTDVEVAVVLPSPALGAIRAVLETDMSFSPPAIDAVLPALNLRFKGNQTIRIEGARFGNVEDLSELLVGDVPCDLLSFSPTTITCLSRRMSATASEVLLRFGSHIVTSPVSILQPTILSMAPAVVPAANDSSSLTFLISLVGLDGVDRSTIAVSVGGERCGSIELVRTGFVQCVVERVPLVWTSDTVDVFVDTLLVQSASFLRFASLPRIDSVSAPSLSTTGHSVVRVRGEGLGTAATDLVAVSFNNVPETSNLTWVSSSEVRVLLPAGVGTDIAVRVHLARNLVTAPSFLSYDPPRVLSVTPSRVESGAQHVDFVVCGRNFGGRPEHFGPAAVASYPCSTVEPLNSSCFLCGNVIGPFTWPAERTASVVVGGQSSTSEPGIFDVLVYPRITALNVPRAPTRGGEIIRAIGEGFGGSQEEVVAVRLGDVELPSFMVLTAFAISFELPAGVGHSLDLVVRTVAGGDSAPFPFSYDPPTVDSITPAYLLVGPHPQSVLIEGNNFGSLATHFSSVTVGGVPCGSIEPRDTTAFVCHGLLANVNVWPDPNVLEVVVAGLSSGRVRGLLTTVDRPRVTSISPREVRVGEEVTISGSGFGVQATDVVSVRVGPEACAAFTWENNQLLRCTLGANHPMFATKPANSSDPTVWPFVQVELRTGGASFSASELADADLSVPRVAPRTWIDAKFPVAVPFNVQGVREVGRFETVTVSWDVVDEELFLNSPTLIVTGFELRARSAAGEEFVAFVPSASARSGELPTSSRKPLVLTVRARNAYGDGPHSHSSDPVLENCDRSTFLATHRDPSSWQCLPCPSEAVCGGLRSENVTSRTGFWRVPWSEAGLGFATCKLRQACVGVDGNLEALVVESAGGDESFGLSATRYVAVPGLQLDPKVIEGCAEGHGGVLCASCQRGYFRTSLGACEPCGSATWIALRVVGLVVLTMVLLGVLLLRAYKAAGESSSGIVRILKILFNHFQTIAIISSIRFQWPPSVADTFAVSNTASSFGVEGVSLECVMGDAGYSPMGRSLVSISTPIWLLLYALAFWAVHVYFDWGEAVQGARRLISGATATQPASDRRDTITGLPSRNPSMCDRWMRRMKVSVPVLVFLVHTNVTTAAFRMITCESVAPDDDPGNGQLRLSMDLEVQCDDPDALAWMVGIAVPVLIFFSLGVPLLTACVIRRNRAQLQDPLVQRLFGFLFFGFREGKEWWEGVNMVRKVMLAGVTVVLGPSGAFNQVGAAQVVIVAFMALHAWYRPYTDASFNRLEMASLFASTLTMASGQFIEGSTTPTVRVYLAPLLLFLANSVFLAMIAWPLLHEAKRRVQSPDAASNVSILSTAPTNTAKVVRLSATSTRYGRNVMVNPLARPSIATDRALGLVSKVRK